MSHNEVPVFLSKAIYMMHACRRLMEDRSPGLLQAANIKLDTVEFQVSTPPPRAPDSRSTFPTEKDLDIDEAMGDEIEAAVAAELDEEDSNMEPLAEDSDVEPLAEDCDVEPLAEDSDVEPAALESDVEPLAQDKESHGNANNYSDSDVEPICQTGDNDVLSNPAASADEDMAASRLFPLFISHKNKSKITETIGILTETSRDAPCHHVH